MHHFIKEGEQAFAKVERAFFTLVLVFEVDLGVAGFPLEAGFVRVARGESHQEFEVLEVGTDHWFFVKCSGYFEVKSIVRVI